RKRKRKTFVDETPPRLSVLAVPDTLARLVVDALDDRGVELRHASSLWHAMALAWDPASPMMSQSASTNGALDAAAPVTRLVRIEPESGRIIWCGCRAAELLAGGVVMTSPAGDGVARLGRAEIGRLAADWLGWSVQLGAAPSRIIGVVPRMGEGGAGG